MAVKRINADLTVTGEVTAAGENLNQNNTQNRYTKKTSIN